MRDGIILVTGGAGYIGTHLVRKLLEQGYRVRVLEKFLYGERGLAEVAGEPRLEIQYGDVCDSKAVSKALAGVRSVVALAALVGDAACDLDPDFTMDVNFESTRTLLAGCRDNGVQRLVFASSCSVYGANGTELVHEDSHLNPVSLYARTRIMSEELLLRECGPIEVIILRLSTVCGWSPRMRFDLMVNTITARAQVERTVKILGAGQWRPHIHVQDAAEAFLLAATDAPDEAVGGVFNIGGQHLNFTIGEIASKVTEQIPDVNVEYDEHVEDRRSYRVAFDRARDVLGFVPARTVDDAIREVRKVIAEGDVNDYKDEIYHNLKWLQRSSDARASA
jgi:nucleoside-diphosphate-sugar epimerase